VKQKKDLQIGDMQRNHTDSPLRGKTLFPGEVVGICQRIEYVKRYKGGGNENISGWWGDRYVS